MADFLRRCYKAISHAEIRCIEMAEEGVYECNAFPNVVF
jgi:hypothetical protein